MFYVLCCVSYIHKAPILWYKSITHFIIIEIGSYLYLCLKGNTNIKCLNMVLGHHEPEQFQCTVV